VEGANYSVAQNVEYEGGYAKTTGWKGENVLASSGVIGLHSTDGVNFTCIGSDLI